MENIKHCTGKLECLNKLSHPLSCHLERVIQYLFQTYIDKISSEFLNLKYISNFFNFRFVKNLIDELSKLTTKVPSIDKAMKGTIFYLTN